MKIDFVKYHGTGNDFIMINDTSGNTGMLSIKTVSFLCDRRFGIGADGLIILKNHHDADFEMIYYNSDGKEGSMCGNGGRCIVAFAKKAGLISRSARFKSIDGIHEAQIRENGIISLKMKDITNIEQGKGYYFLDTGSPHYVTFIKGLKNYDVFGEGRKIRNSNRFREEGTNVNFAEDTENGIFVRTYERGVENETLSCGTGVVASAVCYAVEKNLVTDHVEINTRGGNLLVRFDREGKTSFTNIRLEGHATYVFSGTIELPA